MTINLSDADLDRNPTLKRQMILELNYDERIHKKQFNSLVKSYKDYESWMSSHKIEHKYQQIILDKLSNVYGVRVYDLKLQLKREHLLDNHGINLIIDHLLNNNRFIQVDKKGESDPLLFELYKSPRKDPIEYPHSVWLPQYR